MFGKQSSGLKMKFALIVLCCLLQAAFVFAQTLDEIEKTYDGFKSKFESLKAGEKLYSSEILPLAIKIKDTMDSKEISPALRDRFKALKKELPLSVQVIVWNENTHIFNKHYSKEYMYAVYDGGSLDESRRIVFMWTPGGRHDQGQWEFSTKDKGQTFLIKSVKYNEYLYAAADSYAYDSSRRSIFTWRPKTPDGCEWYVEIVSDNEIMLKFKTFGEYMYAGEDSTWRNSERRNVFTWRPNRNCDNTCVWRLSPESEKFNFEYSV